LEPFARLDEVDWDFAQASTSDGPHGFHPYPAKFIPQIPGTLIAHLSAPGEVVLDPFCGSGTTLVEALAAGRSALGADVNPVAVMITAAKTLRLDGNDEKAVDSILTVAEEWHDLAKGKPHLGTLNVPKPLIPENEAIDFWFDPSVIRELGIINGAIARCSNPKARILAKVALSSIIVSVSKQDSDTRYVRREKKLREGLVLQRLGAKLRGMAMVLQGLPSNLDVSASVWMGDARLLPLHRGSADLVVTSPPYPNAYSYHLYHRTRLLWLGFEPNNVKQLEIGSHRHYSARNGASKSTFQRDMTACFAGVRHILRPRRFACFVIGDSVIRGELVDNCAVLEEAGKQLGFTLVARFERRINLAKKSFNPAIGKIRREHVLIFRAP
jgi:site-specific DNA-methyltransferase (cytosine-N4-specific)